MGKFKRTMFVLALTASFCGMPVLAFAQTGENDNQNDMLSHGLWEVTQVTIEKNTDGRAEKIVNNAAKEVRSHNPCPKELEVNEKTATLRYSNGWEEPAEFTTEGDLTLYTVLGQRFRYEIKEGSLILTVRYNYVNNDLAARRSERITENWTIILKMSRQ